MKTTEHAIGDGWFASVSRRSTGEVLALAFNNPNAGQAVSLGFAGTKGLLDLLTIMEAQAPALDMRGKLRNRMKGQ